MFVENEEPLSPGNSMLLMDEDDLNALVSQTFEYAEGSEDSPYFIASSCSE